MDVKGLIKTHRKKFFGVIIAFAIVAVGCCCYCFLGNEEKEEENVIPFDSTLCARIEALLPDSIGDHLGLYVYDLTADREVFAYRYDQLMSTASNMKLLTALTLLNQRGANYKFNDNLSYSGTIEDGVLHGDICMKFGFNPEFNGDSLAAWSSAISKAGINKVKGNIFLDTPVSTCLPQEEHWERRDFKYYYASPIFLGEKFLKDSVCHYLHKSKVSYSKESILIGTLPANGRVLCNTSSSLKSSLYNMLNHSSNIDAECLMYTLGRENVIDGDYRSAGVEKMKLFIRNEMNADVNKVSVIHDGCGLCPEDKMTAYFIVQLLKYAYDHKEVYNILHASLPVSGKTGTLKNRMIGTSAEGAVRAKTGRLTRNGGVSGLSGYAVAKNGNLLAFSCLSNGIELTKAKQWEEELCLEFVK